MKVQSDERVLKNGRRLLRLEIFPHDDEEVYLMAEKIRVRPRCTLEAFQWDGEPVEGYERIAVGRDELQQQGYNLVVNCWDGIIYAVKGDWITISPAGVPMVWNPTRFEETYERVTG